MEHRIPPVIFSLSYGLAAWRAYASGGQLASLLSWTCSCTVQAIIALGPVFPNMSVPVPYMHVLTCISCYCIHLSMLLGVSEPPYVARKGEWASLLTSLLMPLTHEGYVRSMFRAWPTRFILAEVDTLTKWWARQIVWSHMPSVTRLSSPVLSFFLAQVAGVAIPLVWFPDHTQTRQCSSASWRRAAGTARTPAEGTGHTRTPFPGVPCGAVKAASASSTALHRHSDPLDGDGGLDSRDSGTSVQGRRDGRQRLRQGAISGGALSGYQSPLGHRLLMSLKIATHHEPQELGPSAVDRLSQAVQGRPTAKQPEVGPLRVLSCTVRHGCILVSLDVSQLAASQGATVDGVTAAQALVYAQQLLPGLLDELQLQPGNQAGGGSSATGGVPAAAAAAPLQPGQYLQLQMGSHVVQARWDESSCDWTLQLQPAATGDNTRTSSSQQCLAAALPPAAAAATAGDITPGCYSVRFQLLFQRSAECDEYLFVRGSDPAAVASHDSDSDKPGLQLWVHSQGQYLHTTVEEVNSYTGAVQAVVRVPETALARHHEDGPIADLQMLTCELWSGSDVLLCRTRLLASMHDHAQPSLQPRFGWWGVTPAEAARLVSEVSELMAIASDAGTAQVVQGHQAFVSDLSAWLSIVQHDGAGHLCDMCDTACQSAHPAMLPTALRDKLADALLQHCTATCLYQTLTAVKRQHQLLTASGSIQAATLQLLGTSRCPTCDEIYYHRLRQHLHHAQIFVNMILFIAVFVSASQYVPSTAWHYQLLVHVNGAACLATAVLCALSSFSTAAGPWSHALVGTGALHAVTHVLHLAVEGCSTSVLTALPSRSCIMLVLTHQLFTLISHQAHLWRVLPTRALRLVALVEALLHWHATRVTMRGHNMAVRGWYVAGVVIVPWAMHMHWRRLLRNQHRHENVPTQAGAAGQLHSSFTQHGHRHPHAHKE